MNNAYLTRELVFDLLKDQQKLLIAACTSSPLVPDLDIEPLEFRLRTFNGKTFELLTGSSDYDTDHAGYWGAGTLGVEDLDIDIQDSIRDACDQALDSMTESQI
jgi:hypothetical protein